MIRRLLIANRGEIAVRIARTAREMGIAAVGVYSESDAGGFHLRPMERVVPLGGGPPSDTYLSIPRLLRSGARSRSPA
jgi:acetyl/propionyl-CoA carboxylase alpha subunit